MIEQMTWIASRGSIMDGDRRYLMLRADLLMGLLRELPPDARRPAMEAFATSVRKHGGQLARAYFDACGARPAALLETITRHSPELGWGHWHMDAHSDDAIEVTVDSSPFAEGFGASPDPVCYAIVGMPQAVGSIVYGRPVIVVETGSAVPEGVDRCSFQAMPVSAGGNDGAPLAGEREAP